MHRFTEHDHNALACLFSKGANYPGYKPEEREAPNGDGVVDNDKRYLHIALKYMRPEFEWTAPVLARAHHAACIVAEKLGVPDYMYPRVENSTLRVLEYPAGNGVATAEHADFCLFTLNLWRSTPEDHEYADFTFTGGVPRYEWHRGATPFHMGEIGELCGLGPATVHRVESQTYPQKALVYFAMPANDAKFERNYTSFRDPTLYCKTGQTVAGWLGPRYARSRVAAK